MSYRAILVAVGFAVLANFFWATNAIVGKLAVSSVPAFTLSQFRWWLALLFIAPFGLPFLRRQWHWYRLHWRRLVVLSILSVTLFNSFQYWALEYTQPVNIGALTALMPVMIFILSGWLGQGRLTIGQWLTALIAVVGAYLVLTRGQGLSLDEQSWRGDLLFILGLLGWSCYSVLLKSVPTHEVNGLGLLTFLIGSGSCFIVPFWLSGWFTDTALLPTGSAWWAVLYVAIFPSLVAYFSWIKAVSHGNPSIAGLMMTTAPLFNALLTLFVLHQVVLPVQWLGILCVVVGVALTLLQAGKRTPAMPRESLE
ncbi:DMT family transporter [Saccharospirillum sp. HFRX-1]|uniref:DMT family transporter n=1 Tax=unclassified Saccharospirillum TaxID=2633430 RepID=UPI003714C2B3